MDINFAIRNVRGYGRNKYFVDHKDSSAFCSWLTYHKVKYLHSYSGQFGMGYEVKEQYNPNYIVFALKFLPVTERG